MPNGGSMARMHTGEYPNCSFCYTLRHIVVWTGGVAWSIALRQMSRNLPIDNSQRVVHYDLPDPATMNALKHFDCN